MGKYREEYDAYLQSEHWKWLRWKAITIAGNKCEACHDSETTLVGHHMVYRTPLTECTADDIMCLCFRCHDAFHTWLSRRRKHCSQFDRAKTVSACRKIRSATTKPPKKKAKPLTFPISDLSVWKIYTVEKHMTEREIEALKKLLSMRSPTGSKCLWNWAINRVAKQFNRKLNHLKRCKKGFKKFAQMAKSA